MSEEVSDKMYAIHREMTRMEAAGLWTKDEFIRLCAEAIAVAGPVFHGDSGPCGTLRRHADPAWLRDMPRPAA